jgi:hypothetical protein
MPGSGAKPNKDGLLTCACGEDPTHWEINVEKDLFICVSCGLKYKGQALVTATPMVV